MRYRLLRPPRARARPYAVVDARAAPSAAPAEPWASNRLEYQADSAPKSVSPSPPITSFTKEYAYNSASSFFAQHETRRAILQLGDSLTDVDPSKRVPCDHLLSIGFLNARPDPIKHYAIFDAVIHGNDGSLQPVAELLDEIAPTMSLRRTVSRAALAAVSPLFKGGAGGRVARAG